ncbi:MAG: TonB-dependent receptor [Chitinophagales bacterium]|nr:TonB-dependent receptor [Chitinophagales bacterium]
MVRNILFAAALLLSATAQAQNFAVQGTVTGSDDGQPMTGVNVVVKGGTAGASTDIDGHYSLNVSAGTDTLIFSYLGYITQHIGINNRNVVDVVLPLDVAILDDIVVVGYGTQKKSDLTGAVSSVRGSDLTKIPAASPVQALQGKVAGVQVTSTSGAPGAGAVVRVRGVGTFNNSSPIYVVDGVILDDISFLNSGDIQSMEVLKDASATAIYGSRGSNGVIMVTTKQGKAGGQETPTVNFDAEYSSQILAKKIELLDGKEFAAYVNDITPGSYNNLDAVPNTDWQDLVFQNAPMQNYHLSVAGSSPKSQYYVGLGYFNQQGIIEKSNYERFTFQLNNIYNLSKNFRLGNNLTFAPYEQQNTANATYGAYRAQPVAVPFNPDSTYGEVPGVGNPLADIEYTNNFEKGLRTVGNVFGDVKFLQAFTFRTSFGVDMNYQKNRSFTPVFYVSPQQQNEVNDLFVGNSENVNWLWENTLNYKKTFDKHSVDALAGYTMQEASSEFLSAAATNILGDTKNLWYLNADNINPTSISNGVDPNLNYSLISYLFRANYTYNSKYLLTATFRRDGSSKFNINNRYSNFPSIAGGWNIGNETFMESVPAISNMKLRASYGVIGNEKINYLDQYALVLNQVNGVFGQSEALLPGSTYGKTGNPDLKWESTKQTDIGLEIGFLQNRLSTEFDFYSRTTDDILVELSTPGYFGNGEGVKVRYNAGSVLNRGFEFNVAWNDEVNGFHYRIGLLGTTIHNEVLSVGGNSGVDSVLFGGNLGNGQTVTQSSVGNPIGSFFGYQTDGIFQNEAELAAYPHESLTGVGDLRFVDQNGDGKINAQDRVFLGSPIPDFVYGINLEASYKGFDLSVDLQGQLGNELYNGKEAVRPDLYNFEVHVIDHWTGEGTSTTEPRAASGGVNYAPSDRFIQDGSFLRLRSVTLGYSFSQSIASKIHMKEARLYIRGTNLFTITQFTGYTPEIGSEDVLSNGIDLGTYPITSIYSLGLNLTF